jgi:hypothetical protein
MASSGESCIEKTKVMILTAMRSDNKYNQASTYERGRKDTTYAHVLFFVCIIILELTLTMYKTNE